MTTSIRMFLAGLIVGTFFTFFIVGAFGALPKGMMEHAQRACVHALRTLPTEADSLRYVLLESHNECKHWVLEYENDSSRH